MKKRLIGLLLIGLLVVGCSTQRMTKYYFDDDGKVIAKSEIAHSVIGSRKLDDVSVDMDEGKVNIGSAEGGQGDIEAALLNSTEIIESLLLKFGLMQ